VSEDVFFREALRLHFVEEFVKITVELAPLYQIKDLLCDVVFLYLFEAHVVKRTVLLRLLAAILVLFVSTF